jgi:hypothetical protein
VDIPAMEIPRAALRVGVNKHGAPRLAKRLGEFRSELMAGDNLGVLASEFPGKQAAGVPAEPVITPQRIPIADDERFAPFRGSH